MNLTAEQIEAVKRGEAVRLQAPDVGEDVVVVTADVYDDLEAAVRDERPKEQWSEAVARAHDSWAKENAG